MLKRNLLSKQQESWGDKKSLANDKLKLLVRVGCQKLAWATVRKEQGYTLSTQQPMARKNQNSVCPGKADQTGDHVLISFVIGGVNTSSIIGINNICIINNNYL